MEIVIQPGGAARCVYGEAIPLSELGRLSIRRGSHCEPDANGCWIADLSPVDGPRLGPFEHRSQALTAEVDWLIQNWLPNQAAG